jgi:serine/threonine-protein kinase
VAKLEDDEKLTHTGAVMGTAAYMAPEQARRATDAGPLADVYSIGSILYHMLTGEPPYGNLPPVSRFALLLHEEPARPRSREASIPEGVEAVIQHAMARDIASRVPTALELEGQLAMFDQPVVAPGTATSRIPTRAATENSAQTIALRARVARPVAAAIAVASSLAAGAWLAALLGTMMEPTSGGERALLALIAIGAIAGIATLHVRTLRTSWASSPAVSRYIAPFARALLAGVTTYGAFKLAELGWFSISHSQPFREGIRLVGAGVAAVLGLGWRRWRLDARLRRWIG